MDQILTLSPEDVARTLGTSPWWVREQARRGRIPHLRLGKGRIRLLPEHVDALIALFTIDAGEATTAVPVDLAALGATAKSTRAHRRPPHVEDSAPLF